MKKNKQDLIERYIYLENWLKDNYPVDKTDNELIEYFSEYFNLYTKKYFNIDIKYFSFLRPLYEIQIARLFSKYEKYHKAFKSCNVGSKTEPWHWCCNCPKSLFVFSILSPFLYKEKLVKVSTY